MQNVQDSLAKIFEGSAITGESLEGYSEISSVPVPVRRRDSTGWKSMNDEKLIRSLCVGFANLQGEVDELKGRLKQLNSLSTSINDLNNPKFKLKIPISILISQENGIFYAEPVDFEIYGEGETEKDAIHNLKEVIIVYFENLKQSKDKLSPKLRAKLKLLGRLISYED